MSDPKLMRPPNQQESVETRALEIAVEAKTIIEQHAKTCDQDRVERRLQLSVLNGKIEAMQTSLISQKQDVARIINRGLIWFIGILVVSLGYFLTRFGLPGH